MIKRQANFLVFVFLLFIFLLTANSALALVRCETQYGGGETCVESSEIILDKKVWDPENKRFEDNLADVTPEGFKFALGDRVIYRLKVTNVGNRKFDKLTVSDTLPVNYLKYDTVNASNPRFEYRNGQIAKVSFDLFNLEPGESEEKQIEFIVKSLPNQNTFDCNVVNEVEVWAGDQYSRDTAKICVTSRGKVLGVSTLPKTGSSLLYLLSATALLGGFSGLLLIKLSRKP